MPCRLTLGYASRSSRGVVRGVVCNPLGVGYGCDPARFRVYSGRYLQGLETLSFPAHALNSVRFEQDIALSLIGKRGMHQPMLDESQFLHEIAATTIQDVNCECHYHRD